MSDLHNESIFITGGGSGLGLALVERFIEEGARAGCHAGTVGGKSRQSASAIWRTYSGGGR